MRGKARRQPVLGWRAVWQGLLALLVGVLAACHQEQPAAGPRYVDAPSLASKPLYRLAVHPLHTPEKLAQAYQPLLDFLNASLPDVHFELEASSSYRAYEEKIRARTPEILLPNPLQTLQAQHSGYTVIAMAGEPTDFRGIFLVRKDAAVQRPEDLRGRAVAFPAPTAVAATILPQLYLQRQGINVQHELEKRYVGSQESAMMSVYLGEVAAAATWPTPWRAFQRDHPQEAAQLRVSWETPHMVNNSLMLRDDVPLELRRRLQQLLFALESSPRGRDILVAMQTARFLPADNSSYAPVHALIREFESAVRPVEQP